LAWGRDNSAARLGEKKVPNNKRTKKKSKKRKHPPLKRPGYQVGKDYLQLHRGGSGNVCKASTKEAKKPKTRDRSVEHRNKRKAAGGKRSSKKKTEGTTTPVARKPRTGPIYATESVTKESNESLGPQRLSQGRLTKSKNRPAPQTSPPPCF